LIGCLLTQLANCNQCNAKDPESNNNNSATSPFPITQAMIDEAINFKKANPGRGFELLEQVLKDLKDGNSTTINKQGKDNMTALHFAVRLGSPHIVKALLDRNADPNLQAIGSYTPFHVALYRQFPDLALLILHSNRMNKANLEAPIMGDYGGITALAYAKTEAAQGNANQADWQAVINALEAAEVTK
jgi:ankyrin repeat protein